MAEAEGAGGLTDARSLGEDAFARAAEEGELPGVREDLFGLVELLGGAPQLRKTLADISIPPEAKRALLRDLLGDRIHGQTLSLLDALVARDSLSWRLGAVLDDLALQAVLAEADAEGTLGEVADELFRFARLLEAEPRLRGAITDPVLPDGNKVELVEDLLAGRVANATAELVRDAVRKPGDPMERIQGLADRAAARRNRVVVEARTAIALDADRRDRLARALSEATGRQVDLELVVDPQVVGGVVARVGDEVIDGTVRRKLQLALERLTA